MNYTVTVERRFEETQHYAVTLFNAGKQLVEYHGYSVYSPLNQAALFISRLERRIITATQHNCNACTSRTFYIMLQDDGSIEAFCTNHNHAQVLCNIPALIEQAAKLISGDETDETAEAIRAAHRISGDQRNDSEETVQGETTPDNPAL